MGKFPFQTQADIAWLTSWSVRVYDEACKPKRILNLHHSLNYCCDNPSKLYLPVFHYLQVLLTCNKVFHLQHHAELLLFLQQSASLFLMNSLSILPGNRNFSNSTWLKWFILTSADDRDGVGGGEAGGTLVPSFSPLVSGSGWTRTVARVGLSSSSGGLTSGSSVGHRPISAFSKETGWAKSIGLRTHKKSDVCY